MGLAVTTARVLCCGLAVRACCAVCVRLARARTRSLNWMNRSRVPRARVRARRARSRSTVDVRCDARAARALVSWVSRCCSLTRTTGAGSSSSPSALSAAALSPLRSGVDPASFCCPPRLASNGTCLCVCVCVCVFVSSSSSMTTLPPPPLPPPLQLAELGHACARVRRSKLPCVGMARAGGAPVVERADAADTRPAERERGERARVGGERDQRARSRHAARASGRSRSPSSCPA